MSKVKTRIFSGTVLEQEIYPVSDRVKDLKKAKPKLRFKNDAERQQHKLNISKKNHARLVNENFSPTSLYSTLTFDNDSEVHTFDEAKRIRDNFFRRLRYKHPEAVIFIYMGRGKTTSRIHFHMLSEGVDEETIYKQWRYGEIVDCKKLRQHNFYNKVDYGQDYTGLANYLFDHWTPEQGSHRWKQTRNARKPQREEPTLIKRRYSEKSPPFAPKGYTLVECHSTQYGYQYFKYCKVTVKNCKENSS